jgi:hypothetical protein
MDTSKEPQHSSVSGLSNKFLHQAKEAKSKKGSKEKAKTIYHTSKRNKESNKSKRGILSNC